MKTKIKNIEYKFVAKDLEGIKTIKFNKYIIFSIFKNFINLKTC